MKNAFYFPHDTNAQHDENIVFMMSRMGWAGYGIYWAIIERLHESNDGWLFSDNERLSYAMNEHPDRIRQIINDFDLFIHENGKFTSNRVLRNLQERQKKSDAARRSANFRHGSPDADDANAMRTHSERNAIKERKGKERKEYIGVEKKASTPSFSQKCIEKARKDGW